MSIADHEIEDDREECPCGNDAVDDAGRCSECNGDLIDLYSDMKISDAKERN